MNEERKDDTTEPTHAELIAAAFGVSEDEARFVAATESGEIGGDVIVVPDPDDAHPEESRASVHRAADSAERLKTLEAIKEGLASIDRREGRPMDEVFDDLEQSLGSQAQS